MSANTHDVVEANSLLQAKDVEVFADAGYQGADNRPDALTRAKWYVAMRPGKRRALKCDDPIDIMVNELNQIKARIGAKVEHSFRVIKQQFGFVKVRSRKLKKHGANHHLGRIV